MPDEAEAGKGKRFASDLRRIREKQGVTTKEVQEETKIPAGLISRFEENGLLDHPIFNKVYLRSFVRTYARVINISPAFTLKALEEALEGTYTGRLAEEYLDLSEVERSTQAEEETTEPASQEPEEAAAEAQPAEAPEGEAPPTEEKAQETRGEDDAEVVQPSEPSISREEASGPEEGRSVEEQQPEAEPSSEKARRETSAASAASGAAVEETRTQRGQQASTESEVARSRQHRGKRKKRSSSSNNRSIAYFVGALVIIALGGWLVFSMMSGGDGPVEGAEGTGSSAAATDTAQAAETPASPAQTTSPEPVDMGETMDFTAVASQGPVRELRVKVDDEMRRPYWIEEGEQRTFEAQNRITFEPPIEATQERPLDMVTLELEGVEYPTDQRDAQGRIIVTRETAQAFLDSVAAR